MCIPWNSFDDNTAQTLPTTARMSNAAAKTLSGEDLIAPFHTNSDVYKHIGNCDARRPRGNTERVLQARDSEKNYEGKFWHGFGVSNVTPRNIDVLRGTSIFFMLNATRRMRRANKNTIKCHRRRVVVE